MTTTINATCACSAFKFQAEFPTASLPIDRALCLCTSCRRVSGSSGLSAIKLPSSYSLSIDISKYDLTAYLSSSDLTRYFCTTCGSHVLLHRKSEKEDFWNLTTGIWDRTEGIINWTGCKWVEDSLDGGISVWFKEILGRDADGEKRELKRWMLRDGNGELVPDGKFEVLPPREDKENKEGEEILTAQCHCGGVKFHITRPNEDSKKVQSPFSDLMAAYHSHSPLNPNNEPWFLRNNSTKYLAGTCVCTSCRLSSGFEIQPWAFIPKCNIFQSSGEPLDFNMGTLKKHASSEGVWREFCGVCGATVFWHCEERPELIDVSVGLLDPEEGARVERWLEWWTGRVSFEELAVSKSLVSSLENGLKAWKQKI